GDRGGRGRAQSAGERDLVGHLDPPADARGQLAADLVEDRLDADDAAVRPIGGQLLGSLAVDDEVDLAATPAADLDRDTVRQAERDAEAVVAGAEVRARGWHLDRHAPA